MAHATRAGSRASDMEIAGVLLLIDQPGCPLCRARDDAVSHAIAWLWVEGYNDFDWCQRLAASNGMCREHWWQALTSARTHAFGASCIGEFFTNAAMRDLAREEQTLRQRTALQRRGSVRIDLLNQWWARLRARAASPMARAQPCPLCAAAALDERSTLRHLYRALHTPDGWKRYERSDGLCLPHLRQALGDALGGTSDESAHAVALALVADMRRRLYGLAEEFAQFFHTMDYRYHDEPRGVEQTAWLRALERFAGPPIQRPARTSQADAHRDAHEEG